MDVAAALAALTGLIQTAPVIASLVDSDAVTAQQLDADNDAESKAYADLVAAIQAKGGIVPPSEQT